MGDSGNFQNIDDIILVSFYEIDVSRCAAADIRALSLVKQIFTSSLVCKLHAFKTLPSKKLLSDMDMHYKDMRVMHVICTNIIANFVWWYIITRAPKIGQVHC